MSASVRIAFPGCGVMADVHRRRSGALRPIAACSDAGREYARFARADRIGPSV